MVQLLIEAFKFSLFSVVAKRLGFPSLVLTPLHGKDMHFWYTYTFHCFLVWSLSRGNGSVLLEAALIIWEYLHLS